MLALALAFLLELVAFGYFAAVSFTFDLAKPVQIALFVVLLGALITFWSIFMAPRAVKKFKPFAYYVAKAVVYGVSAYAIYQLASPKWFWIFVVCAVLDDIVLFKHNLEQPSRKP